MTPLARSLRPRQAQSDADAAKKIGKPDPSGAVAKVLTGMMG